MLETLQKMLAGEDAFTVTIYSTRWVTVSMLPEFPTAVCKEQAILAADRTGIVLDDYICIPWSAISSLQINVV